MHRDTIIASRGNTAGGKGYHSGAALIDKHVIIIIVHGKLFSIAVGDTTITATNIIYEGSADPWRTPRNYHMANRPRKRL